MVFTEAYRLSRDAILSLRSASQQMPLRAGTRYLLTSLALRRPLRVDSRPYRGCRAGSRKWRPSLLHNGVPGAIPVITVGPSSAPDSFIRRRLDGHDGVDRH